MRKKANKKRIRKKNASFEKKIERDFISKKSSHHLLGVKLIVLGLLLYAVYSLVLIILYSSALLFGGVFKESVVNYMFNKAYIDEFVSLYGQVKAENFFLLIGIFGSLITFVLDIWFSFGLWKKKNIARLTVAAFSLVLLAISIFDLLFAGYDGSMQIIWIIIYALISVYLLLNKHVKMAFKQ
jgi:hypothetical protein